MKIFQTLFFILSSLSCALSNVFAAENAALSAAPLNWTAVIFNFAGGLALLLFAMSYINESLQKAAGQKFRSILASLTSSRIKGAATGFVLTGLNQSSSATMLLTVSLVGAGLITFFQSMSVSLGASLGSTITGQLMAFKLSHYALPIMASGFAVSFLSGKNRLSCFGGAVFGFGLLFFGMKLMSDASSPLAQNPQFLDFISRVQSPVFSILAGVAVTLIMQSSGAVVAMIIALASSGALNLNQAVCMAIGSQIGTCITVVLASIKLPRSAKRTMLWQIFQQILAAVLVFPFLSFFSCGGEGAWFVFVKWITKTICFSDNIGRQIAMSHTFVAFFNMLIMLVFLKYFQKLAFLVYPFKNEEMTFGAVYIDSKSVEKNADKALLLSKKEIQRLGEFVLDMFANSMRALEATGKEVAENVSYKGVKIDLLSKEIIPYIAKVGQKKLTEGQSRQEIKLLYILSDLNEITDIIDRSVINIAKKRIAGFSHFSKEGLDDIKKFHSIIYSNFLKVLHAFDSGDKQMAKEAAESKHDVRTLDSELKKKHIARLHANLKESLETSGMHMDVLDQFTRINSRVCDIGRIIAGE